MKIEMGESLLYSWLRHVKECQVVQTNWKVSPSWQLRDEDALQRFMDITADHFQRTYGYIIYKNNTLSQLLLQAEIDAVGICLIDKIVEVHAVDVAFHKDGLLYGSGRQETISQVIKKSVRAAMCMVGYFGVSTGEVIFASPKIHNAVINDLALCITDLNTLFIENGYGFTARVIANDDFNDHILKPILIASGGVSDTSELFIRGYQLVTMFGDERPARKRSMKAMSNKIVSDDILDDDYDSARYYTKPLTIQGNQYRLCSQWFEVAENNNRPFLLAWLEKHGVLT